MYRKLAKILEWFAKIWGFLVGISVALSAIMILITEGWFEFIWFFSPFNLRNYLVIFLLLSPAAGAYALSEYLLKRAKRE